MHSLRLVVSVLTLTVAAGSAYGCSVPMSQARQDQALQHIINNADHVLVGMVRSIKRRRWGPDDEIDPIAKRTRARGKRGLKVHGYMQNIADFSDATATLRIVASLKSRTVPTVSADERKPRRRREPVIIDLLRPFSVAGHGPCMNFPRTCPWDIKPGEFVVAAITETQYQPWRANLCIRFDRKTRPKTRELREKLKTSSVAEVLWPYLEMERERIYKRR